MKVEFTKRLKSNSWNDLRIAVNERADNLEINKLSEKKQLLLEKVKTRPESFFSFEEYGLLLEMAAQTKKLWKQNSIIEVYFFGGQR